MSAPSHAQALPLRRAERLAAVPAHVWALAGITALGAILRFSTLTLQSFWVDEAATVYLVKAPFATMWGAIPSSESTPPLYYVLAWLWAQVFGDGEAGLRSLSALIGTATIPVAYAAAARLITPRVGLVVAALAAVNPLLVWFSQEARAYALLLLLATASLALFARLIDEQPTARRIAAWAVVSALALVAHYFAIFVVAPQAAWLLWRYRGVPERRGLIAGTALIVAAGAALLPMLIEQAGNDRADFIRQIDLPKRVAQVPKQFLVGFDAPLEAVVTALALVLAGIGLWLLALCADGRERRGAGIAAVILAFALLVPLALAIAGVDYVIARNVIAAWVPAAIVLAAGFGARRAGRAGIAAAAALSLVSLFAVVAVDANPRYQRGDWQGAARALGSLREPRAVVITPVVGKVPLSLYTTNIADVPPYALPLRDIVAIGVAERRTGQTPEPPRPTAPPAPLPGFRLVERRYEDTYTLLHYRAEAWTYLVRDQLAGMRVGAGVPDVEVQTPPGWQWPPPGAPPGPGPPGHLP